MHSFSTCKKIVSSRNIDTQLSQTKPSSRQHRLPVPLSGYLSSKHLVPRHQFLGWFTRTKPFFGTGATVELRRDCQSEEPGGIQNKVPCSPRSHHFVWWFSLSTSATTCSSGSHCEIQATLHYGQRWESVYHERWRYARIFILPLAMSDAGKEKRLLCHGWEINQKNLQELPQNEQRTPHSTAWSFHYVLWAW